MLPAPPRSGSTLSTPSTLTDEPDSAGMVGMAIEFEEVEV